MFLRKKYAEMSIYSRQVSGQRAAKFAVTYPLAVAYFARPATCSKPAAREMIHVD